MNGRMYDPNLSRFLSPDNYVQNPYNTQNYNRYGYVLNNPLMYTDPSGEMYDWGDPDLPSNNNCNCPADFTDVPGSEFYDGLSDTEQQATGNILVSLYNFFTDEHNQDWIKKNIFKADVHQFIDQNWLAVRDWVDGWFKKPKKKESPTKTFETSALVGPSSMVNFGTMQRVTVSPAASGLGISRGGDLANSGGGENFSLAGMYAHFQIGGTNPMTINSSSLDFSGTSQKQVGLAGMKKGESREGNLFNTGINSQSLSFGRLEFTYQGNNQFSITDNMFDFDYQVGQSFSRNAGTILGGAVNYNVFPSLLIRSPIPTLIPIIFGGPYNVIFNGNVTIPE